MLEHIYTNKTFNFDKFEDYVKNNKITGKYHHFLNKEWKDEYGGHLEFWNQDLTQCIDKIKPDYNTFVIFNTSDLTPHGHPHPLTCPNNRSRQSLILYFYTSGRPEEEIVHDKVHRALYTPRNELGNPKS